MNPAASAPWHPTRFVRLAGRPLASSTGAAKVKTNATFGYLKAMGNGEGPHALACEWVGSSLAKWFGLSVPEFAIVRLTAKDRYSLPGGRRTEPGPAFVSRFVPGDTWGGSLEELQCLENPRDLTRLVVFDTWVRNCDRHPPAAANRKPNERNVYLGATKNADLVRLYAIDHTHCFDGRPELTPKLADLDIVRDDDVYGLFPAFRAFIDSDELAWCKGFLQAVESKEVRSIVDGIPIEWEVSPEARNALIELICRRAAYLADKIQGGWGSDWRASSEGAS
jgi:hypothetical protein